MLQSLKAPAALLEPRLLGMALTVGDKRVKLIKLTPRSASQCNPHSGRPLFQQPRPDAAVHEFENGLILCIAAGPDKAKELLQVDGIRLEDGTPVGSCSRIAAYLGLADYICFTAVITGNEMVLSG